MRITDSTWYFEQVNLSRKICREHGVLIRYKRPKPILHEYKHSILTIHCVFAVIRFRPFQTLKNKSDATTFTSTR